MKIADAYRAAREMASVQVADRVLFRTHRPVRAGLDIQDPPVYSIHPRTVNPTTYT